MSPNRSKLDKHSHTMQFESTTYTVRPAPQSTRVNKSVVTSKLPQIHFSSSHYVTFTGVNSSVIGGDQFILVVVGTSAGALFLLGFIVTATLLGLWRCLHAKDNSPGRRLYIVTYGAHSYFIRCMVHVCAHTWCLLYTMCVHIQVYV